MGSPTNGRVFSQTKLFLAMIAVSTVLVGCSSQAKHHLIVTQPTTNNSPTSKSNSIGQSATSQPPTNSSSSGTGQPTSTAKTSTAKTSNSRVILYVPTVDAVNTLRISGRVSGATSTRKTTVLIKNAETNTVLSQTQVSVSSSGSFTVNMPVTSGQTPIRLKILATYPNAVPAAVTRYFTPVLMKNTTPKVVLATRKTVTNMGANFPVLLPTWFSQSLSTAKPKLSAYSTTVAAKSFTYSVQLWHTIAPFPVNSSKIQQTADKELATVGGVQFKSNSAAQTHMMYRPNEALPNASVQSKSLKLLGSLHATVYADKWHTVTWHEGDWLIVVRGPVAQQNVTDAKRVAKILDKVYLPPTNGVVWVRNISDGTGPGTPNTLVSFVKGRNLYTVSSQGHIYAPLVLASSMKP